MEASADPRAETQQHESLALRSHLSSLLSKLDVDCVLDVGANIGYYGRILRWIGYDGWIVSFEPVADVFRQLSEATRDDPKWRAFDFALGAREETRDIGVAENSVLSSFLEPSEYQTATLGQQSNVTERQRVPVHMLDSVLAQCLDGIADPRIFLKLDTQGWDMEVLSGSMETLRRALGVQVELSIKALYDGSPDWRDTITWLNQQGFELTGLFTVIRDPALRVIEQDCVMARVP